MPLISYSNLGQYGLMTDVAAAELPPGSWTSARNMHFSVKGAEKVKGQVAVYGTPTVEPLFALPVTIGGVNVWAYAGEEKIYSVEGTTHRNITRQTASVDVDYSATSEYKWSGGAFNNLGIFNNPTDVPQVWIPTSASDKVIDLPNWPAALRCKTMRSFRNFLVAMDLTNSGTHYPTAIRWSHPADPAAVPVTWDIADETKDAGEWYFNETPGEVVDLVSMRNEGVVYKTDAIHSMAYVGGVFVFRFRGISNMTGIPCKRAAIEFKPGLHFLWTGDDIVVLDGQNLVSIVTDRIRSRLADIAATTTNAVFCAVNSQANEVWFCYGDDTDPTRAVQALVWNWDTKAWGVKDLPNMNFAVRGLISPETSTGSDWNGDTDTWDADSASWTDAVAASSRARLLGGNAANLLYMESGSDNQGTAYQAFCERHSIGVPFKQNQPPDISSMKFCKEIWPRISGDDGTSISVTIGTQQYIGGDISWADPQTYIIGETDKLNCTESGRLFALRFESNASGLWTLNGFDLDVNMAGSY